MGILQPGKPDGPLDTICVNHVENETECVFRRSFLLSLQVGWYNLTGVGVSVVTTQQTYCFCWYIYKHYEHAVNYIAWLLSKMIMIKLN